MCKDKNNIVREKKYKNYNKELTKVIRNAKILYETKEMQKIKFDTRKTWQYVKERLKSKKKEQEIDFVFDNDRIVMDKRGMANAFNELWSWREPCKRYPKCRC